MKNRYGYIPVIVVIMFLVSLMFLGVLTVLMWKLECNSSFLSGGVIAVYVITNLLGGLLAGRVMGQQKYFWGILVGIIYFLVLLLTGVIFMGTKVAGNQQLISGILICMVSGMLGGMLAPGEGGTNLSGRGK